MRRLWCWLVGHEKTNRHVDVHRVVVLGHLSPDAGVYWECARCGVVWDDLSADARTHFRSKGATLRRQTP